jgi:hypothetical protein
MNKFEADLASAGDALSALANGPGQDAANALETAFGRAGASIEKTLAQAARSGELDFKRMAESILRDLARIATEALIARSGLGGADGQAGQTVNLNMALGAGADASSVLASQGMISAALARAASAGGRFI